MNSALEVIVCYWCEKDATHDAQASGDRLVPACDTCSEPEQ